MKDFVPIIRACLMACMVSVLSSSSVFAQDATIVGKVVDESKGALPGVNVSATAVATNREFHTVTDAQGDYRLVGLSAGEYVLRAAMTGFATTVISDIELLVGRNVTIPVVLKLSAMTESVTVTQQALLVDRVQAQVAGNVDRRQMEQLPIAGRNWQQLATMVKGITENSITTRPVRRDASFQLNLDGQNITQNASVSGFGQPGISRDAIAEFQVITNLFDVTMGRSTGVQVNAITRAGTNMFSGSTYGYFRDDKLNARDAFAGRVLPYSNQQAGGTFGGPIKYDKMHFFGSYEYEREPNTTVFAVNALAGQRFEVPTLRDVNTGLGRVDVQLTPRDHLTVRAGGWKDLSNSVSGHATRAITRQLDSTYTTAAWSHVGRTNMLHEVKVSYLHYHWLIDLAPGMPNVPQYSFPGLTIGPPSNQPQNWFEDFVTTRYDMTWQKGSHDLKIGAEWRVGDNTGWHPVNWRGTMQFSSTPADVARRFPYESALDPSGWDLTGLDSIATRFTINLAQTGFGMDGMGGFAFDIPRPMIAAWIGDTWRAHNRLSLNLGVRYDVAWKDLVAPGVQETTLLIDSGLGVQDFGYRNDIRDLNNVAPRFGLAWTPTAGGDLVIRGGAGLYFSSANSNQPVNVQTLNAQRVFGNTYVNDGLPGWVEDPMRGTTIDDILSGAVPLQPQTIHVIAHDFQMPYAMQAMVGFQKQLSPVLGFDADLVHYRGYNEDSQRDPNLFYDFETGLPKNPNVHGRPNPNFGPIALKESKGKSDYLALASSLTRRYHKNFQLGVTYTVMFYKRDTGIGSAGYGATQLNSFNIMTDWTRGADFQRHTLRANGVWNLPYDISLAGAFGYGSGNYTNITTNVDPVGIGANRIRSNLSVIPRNSFKGSPFQTLDLRVSKDFKLSGTMKLTGIAEIFNLYNYAQYGYNTLETSANFGLPTSSTGPPRTGQLAFRLSF